MATTTKGKGPVNPVDGLEQAADEYLIGTHADSDSDEWDLSANATSLEPPIELKALGAADHIAGMQLQAPAIESTAQTLRMIADKIPDKALNGDWENVELVNSVRPFVPSADYARETYPMLSERVKFAKQGLLDSAERLEEINKTVDVAHAEQRQFNNEELILIKNAAHHLELVQKTLAKVSDNLRSEDIFTRDELADIKRHADHLQKHVLPIFEYDGQLGFKHEQSPAAVILKADKELTNRHAARTRKEIAALPERVIAERSARHDQGLEAITELNPSFVERRKEERAQAKDDVGAYI